jgi:hypothetical protein
MKGISIELVLMAASQSIKPLLDWIWNEEDFTQLKVTIEAKLRVAADLAQFTEANDILVEDIIDCLNDKEFQDTVLDIIEDAAELTPVAPLIVNAIEFMREKIGVPDGVE